MNGGGPGVELCSAAECDVIDSWTFQAVCAECPKLDLQKHLVTIDLKRKTEDDSVISRHRNMCNTFEMSTYIGVKYH